MVELETAEATTKHLRSKEILPLKAVEVALALLDGSLDVFLINKHHFVFNLLCDRLNDLTGKDFKIWKLEPLAWTLWERLWRMMGEVELDLDVRTKSFRRVKLVAIVASVLQQSTSGSNTELLEAMFSCVATILSSGYVDVDEFTATGLLSDYVKWLENETKEDAKINDWTTVILQIYQLPRQSSQYKPTKKSTARYFSSVLPHILNILSSPYDLLLEPTINLLKLQNRIFLFEIETPRSLCSHMDDVLAYDGLLQEAVELLFQEVVNNLAAKDIALCEAVFISITKCSKFSELSERLLQVLADVNRTLSPEFFQNMYIDEISRQPVRWGLVGHLVSLSPSLAVEKAQEIVDTTKGLSEEDICILAPRLAQGFIRAREFNSFIETFFPLGVSLNPCWNNEFVVNSLSSKCNELSANQFSTLLNLSLEKKQKETAVLLLKGLLMCPTSKRDAAVRVLESSQFSYPGWSEVVYFLLCNYGHKFLSDGLLKSVVPGKPQTKYDFYLTFRIAELTASFELVEEKEVARFIKKNSTTDTLALARRWLVLFEPFEKIHTAIIEKFMLDQGDALLELLKTEAPLVFELSGFLKSLLTYISKHPKFPNKSALFCMMPLPIYRKFFVSFTDDFCKDSIKSQESKIILKYIFQDANGSSLLEKDIKFFKKFLACDDTQITFEIGELVWDSHITNFKSQASSNFVNEILRHLEKNLKKDPSNTDLKLAQIVIKGKKPKSNDFNLAFEIVCELYVALVTKKKTLSNDLIAVLAYLPSPLLEKISILIKKLLKSMGKERLDDSLEQTLFALAVKTSASSFHGALYVISLFLALLNNSTFGSSQSVKSNLIAYFQSLPSGDFDKIYLHLLAAGEDAASPFIDPIIRILTILAHQLDKERIKEHTKLFVSTILLMSIRTKDVENIDTLHEYLSTITVMLSDHPWIFSQYAIELTLAYVVGTLKNSRFSNQSKSFIALIDVISYIALFHRFRITSRYHLLISALSEIMNHLTRKEATAEEGAVFSRLLVTLCEPPIQRSTKESESLTSQAAVYKRVLRKQAHILLINYVHMQVSAPLKSSITDALMPGIYSLFGLLSKLEMQLANQLLDLLGRVYFKNLYQGFKDHGKWKN